MRILEPYIAYFKKSFLSKSAYRFDHLMSILSTCLRIFIFWEIYRALYGTKQEVDGITMAMVTTNFILSMGLDAVFYMNDYFLPNKIYDGSIAIELLRPMSFQGRSAPHFYIQLSSFDPDQADTFVTETPHPKHPHDIKSALPQR